MKFIKVFFCLFIYISFVQEELSANESPSANILFEDLSIVVFSCDKYQELWAPFFEMFFKSLPSLKTTNVHVPIYLVANSQKYNDARVTTINIQNEKSWSDNALTVLASVKTKYVWIILEDYFFTRIDEKRLYEVFNFIRSEDVAYCQLGYDCIDLATRRKKELFPGVAEKDRYELWRTSLYSCIWRAKDMAHILKSGESIWEFEIAGTIRSQGLYGKFLSVFENQPVEYLNMVQQGYLNSGNVKKIQEMGTTFNRMKLELDSDHTVKLFLYYRVFSPIKEFIRGVINSSRELLRNIVRKVIPSFDSN